jgi:hypothetical protein
MQFLGYRNPNADVKDRMMCVLAVLSTGREGKRGEKTLKLMLRAE